MTNFIDLHQDLYLHLKRPELFKYPDQTSFEKNQQAKAKIIIASAFPVPNDEDLFQEKINDLIEEEIGEYLKFCQKENNWQIISSQAGFKACLETKDQIGLILHLEGLNVFKGRKADWLRLERWHDLGLRSLGLVWNKSNSLGGGTEDIKKGLSKLGKEVLAWAEEKQILIDLAHMNEKTFWQTLENTTGPIFVSHANARSIYDHPRNLTDEQLKAIAKRNGLVGAFFSPNFINGPESNLNDLLNHFNHLLKILSEDKVAMGSDFGGLLKVIPKLESIKKINNLKLVFEKAGYSKVLIEKIMFQNAQNWLLNNLKAI